MIEEDVIIYAVSSLFYSKGQLMDGTQGSGINIVSYYNSKTLFSSPIPAIPRLALLYVSDLVPSQAVRHAVYNHG